MNSPIARILHFSFETAEDLELWVLKYQTETSELAKEAIQRTLIKTDETSLVICNIYAMKRMQILFLKGFQNGLIQ